MRDLKRTEVEAMMREGAQLVEILAPHEYDEDHLPGAINIPLRRIETDAVDRLDKDRAVVVYCWDTA